MFTHRLAPAGPIQIQEQCLLQRLQRSRGGPGGSGYRRGEGDKGVQTTEEGRETRGGRLQMTGGREGGSDYREGEGDKRAQTTEEGREIRGLRLQRRGGGQGSNDY